MENRREEREKFSNRREKGGEMDNRLEKRNDKREGGEGRGRNR